MRAVLGLGLATGLVLTGAMTAAAAPPPKAPPAAAPGATEVPQRSDAQRDPLSDKQEALRKQALNLVLTGQSKVRKINGSYVVKVGKKPASASPAQQRTARAAGAVAAPKLVDQYVELDRERTDKIFVVLTEFGNQRDARFPDKDTDPTSDGPTTFDGPRHNQIPEPDRSKDNTTVWQQDYSPAYFKNLYFGEGDGVDSVKSYYEKQSSGRYSVDGTVTGWVKVPYNEARYGRSDDPDEGKAGDDPNVCGSNVCNNTWALIRDGVSQWVTDQKRLFGRTDAQIKRQLAEFDQQDRYDYDGDGDFNEPDGYIDHFQIVHSGGDQADGDPQQGEDAIWSHKWYAYADQQGVTGPAQNKLGGTPIGDSGIWVGNYTIQPENGGLSVFTHEFGHDLGLPDLYDTVGPSPADQPMEFWSLMAQSRLSAAGDQGIGTRPGDLGAWEKMQLGWLDYEVAVAGQKKTFDLGPHEYNSGKPQAVVTVLPPKAVSTTLPTPPEGTRQWWSGAGDDYDASLTRSVTLPAGASTLSFKTSWNIEGGYDYAYVQVDDGSGWKSLAGDITDPETNNGITGLSKGYVPATFDLSAYAGKTVQLRFRYLTDSGVQGQDTGRPSGLFVDDVTVVAGATTVLADGAESGDDGWTRDGFSAIGATSSRDYPQYYLASYRSYTSFDRYLRTGPYDLGYGPSLPDKVDHFPYQDGLQVTFWDGRYTDNNVSVHPGNGQILTVDAHPDPVYRIDGAPWRARVQLYDATFGRQKADSFTLHVNGQPSYVRGQAAVPTFDDTRSYFRAATPKSGVRVAGAGVTMSVLEQDDTSMRVAVGTSTSVSASTTLARARQAVRAS
ncbi:immune inhibitor A domain-containing protein [Microlunatus flavus]|uniref:immune inhibitor A domain-containing protein n=1 Tax=Microlunatus flavus TaxID=1036181 RepID=UPI001E3E583C|nr:immune inhibitor A domain-containing protein [Microlunatus flavus]